jgi:membrane-associated phospholipid phosphatase
MRSLRLPKARAVDRNALAWAAPLAILSLVLGVLAAFYDTFPGDETVSAWARALGSSFAPVANVFNHYQLHLGIPIYLLGVCVLLRRRRYEAAAVAVAVGAARPVLQLAKIALGRPRPVGDFEILDVVVTPSFPSGHVLTAATFVGVWIVFAPQIVGRRYALPVRLAGVAAVVLMGIARMWAGVHWFSDTYGAVVWVAAAFALALAYRHWLPRPAAEHI